MELDAQKSPIFLTGFAGAGKSTIGKALAFLMHRQFFDLDNEIELLSGMSIERIFADQGESGFRRWESQILQSLALTQDSVIALGGGTLISEMNSRLVLRRGFLVHVDSSIQRIIKNLSQDLPTRRPLLKDQNLIPQLMSERSPGYQKAHLKLLADDLSVQEMTQKIQSGFEKWRKEESRGLN